MFKKILHANDGSKGADKALALALGLAKQEARSFTSFASRRSLNSRKPLAR